MPGEENAKIAEKAGMKEEGKKTLADYLPVFWMCAVFVISQLLALVAMRPFAEAGMQAFENPSDPLNALIYILIILGFTAVILLIAKFKMQKLIKWIVLGALFFTMFYVFWPLL
ncbi:MAG: presenilin family intramembrane aspartyl protease, partial [Candidatus Thermoplasmatota archaeon]|nr:presenilin family intramembrane aspartyl protease [Candidatus Thermoplasmatota archaeon]